ncbi:glycosyltransferase family 9 protein [Aggregatibacter kilianii]|uniref:glycosyltransferase family 9 protein n=1 Tax=Aggregatibacter kilianii TaxID=2025884 RepID=UPI000D69B32A|nr:glycosyltransferase family 9 protein [Aggregatibacter kilianii]
MNIKLMLQTIRLTIGKLILDKKTPKNSTALSPKKILFLRQDGKIGDYIVSSFIFREIKKFNSEIKIGVVCTTKDAYLFKQNPHIDQLYFVKKRSILDYIKSGLALAKEKYDVVIDPTLAIKNRDLLLLRLINAKNYIGYKKSNYKIFTHSLENDEHFSKIYQQSLELAGITNVDTTYDIPYDEKSAVEIQNFLQENNISDYITVNFFGAYRAKKVNNENIKRYLRYLTETKKDKQFILLSYPEVTPLLKELAQGYKNIYIHDTTTIFHTIELIRHSVQLISTDTSTVHIASGFNKPIIAMYKKDPIAFKHWNPNCSNETHILFYKENINELNPEEIKAEWLN